MTCHIVRQDEPCLTLKIYSLPKRGISIFLKLSRLSLCPGSIQLPLRSTPSLFSDANYAFQLGDALAESQQHWLCWLCIQYNLGLHASPPIIGYRSWASSSCLPKRLEDAKSRILHRCPRKFAAKTDARPMVEWKILPVLWGPDISTGWIEFVSCQANEVMPSVNANI